MTRRSLLSLLTPAAIAAAVAVLALGAAQAGAQGGDCEGWIPPNTLTLTAGSPQQGQIGKPFQTNMQVQLANTNGCPITGSWAGVSIVFTAPASGAGGTFASTDTNVADVGTDANGTAMAPTFTANRTAGNYEVLAGSSYGAVTLYLTNTATGVAASIAAHGSNSRSATVSGRYQPLQAVVLDSNGRPVAGATVSFQVGAGITEAGATFAGGGVQATAVTDTNGVATSSTLTANGTAGRFTALASTDGVDPPATFQLRNLDPQLTAAARTETGIVNARYPRPLKARVLDTHGRPVQGMTVTFALPQAATDAGAVFLGGASQVSATTNAHGEATSPPLIANSGAGRFTATASVLANPKPLTYSLHNLAGPPATITTGAASGASTATGRRFPIPLAVTVTDKAGNAVTGAIVTFTAPSGHGPGGHFTIEDHTRDHSHASRIARAKTDRDGVAVAPPFTANAQAGGYAVTARAGATKTAFALVNRPR